MSVKNSGTGWIALYQNSSIWLAQQHLTGEQFKVMHVLFGKLDFENFLRISRQEIADITGITSYTRLAGNEEAQGIKNYR